MLLLSDLSSLFFIIFKFSIIYLFLFLLSFSYIALYFDETFSIFILNSFIYFLFFYFYYSSYFANPLFFLRSYKHKLL